MKGDDENRKIKIKKVVCGYEFNPSQPQVLSTSLAWVSFLFVERLFVCRFMYTCRVVSADLFLPKLENVSFVAGVRPTACTCPSRLNLSSSTDRSRRGGNRVFSTSHSSPITIPHAAVSGKICFFSFALCVVYILCTYKHDSRGSSPFQCSPLGVNPYSYTSYSVLPLSPAALLPPPHPHASPQFGLILNGTPGPSSCRPL